MSYSVKAKDLQVGMKVVNPILGKKGDIKVRSGEILSNQHVTGMKKWKGLDEANPGGMVVESSPLHSGSDVPSVIDKPWESPIVEKNAKHNLQTKSFAVPAIRDAHGNVLNPSPIEREFAVKEKEKKDVSNSKTKPRV